MLAAVPRRTPNSSRSCRGVLNCRFFPDLLCIQPDNLREENGASQAPWELESVAVPFCCSQLKQEMWARKLSLKAFLSRRVVTPRGMKAGGVLVQDGRILDVVPPDQLPAQISMEDFGDAAILPGLVDSHVHINEPGRTQWEGFRTATRAAAAGGYTLLVDMPLNCLPATATGAALEAKRKAENRQFRT